MNELFKKEDYWAIWIGFAFLLSGLIAFLNAPPEDMRSLQEKMERVMAKETANAPYKTVTWYKAYDQLQKLKGGNTSLGKFLKKLTGKPSSWTSNPLHAFVSNKAKAAQNYQLFDKPYQAASLKEKSEAAIAKQRQAEAKALQFEGVHDNNAAIVAIKRWRVAKKKMETLKKKRDALAYNHFLWLLGLLVLLGGVFGIGAAVMDTPFLSFFRGFLFVFLIGLISYLLAAQANMKAIGFGYAAWAIILGLLISNTIGTPKWVIPALSTEFYIKTGLVILGAEILFGKILAIGLPGIFVAWIVTPIVLVSTFWLGQKILKISSKTLNMTISADMSVCGVSAAVATAAACKASKEELTIAIGLSMIFTSVMMIVLPLFINWVGIPEILGGAWIGGTIDATGAVVAAGAFLGDKALNVAATIKMIQNILIGVIAFGVAVYFATKVEKTGTTQVGWGEIWKRFPKFILGFIGASILFSIVYAALGDNAAYTLIDQGVLAAFTKNIRGWLFCLAFVSIGLSINFKELSKHFTGGKPLILYLCGQTFNLCLTLLMAYIMFYLVFPNVTEGI